MDTLPQHMRHVLSPTHSLGPDSQFPSGLTRIPVRRPRHDPLSVLRHRHFGKTTLLALTLAVFPKPAHLVIRWHTAVPDKSLTSETLLTGLVIADGLDHDVRPTHTHPYVSMEFYSIRSGNLGGGLASHWKNSTWFLRGFWRALVCI